MSRTSVRAKGTGDCGCGPAWCKPKPNGTCAACGGWLPGERPASFVAKWGEPADTPAPESHRTSQEAS